MSIGGFSGRMSHLVMALSGFAGLGTASSKGPWKPNDIGTIYRLYSDSTIP